MNLISPSLVCRRQTILYLVTNLPATEWSADEIVMIYRCRWQVELPFKELKSDTNWRRFATSQQAIMEGLVWGQFAGADHP